MRCDLRFTRPLSTATVVVMGWNRSSLHNRRFMSQARPTRHFARSVKRVRSARRGEENAWHSFRAWRKMPRSPRLAHKGPVMQATILDKINGKPRPPLPPKSRMGKWRVFALRAASSLIWGGWGFAVPFYFVQDCRIGEDERPWRWIGS